MTERRRRASRLVEPTPVAWRVPKVRPTPIHQIDNVRSWEVEGRPKLMHLPEAGEVPQFMDQPRILGCMQSA